MTLLEAMAMQVPTVASRLDGIAEVVTDGIDGLLAEPDDRDGFAAKVRLLLDDSARAAQIAEAARALVSSRFAAERMTREVEALYEKYLGNQ
jgi:glycosyltransferase involved in cell wall biosynthesis